MKTASLFVTMIGTTLSWIALRQADVGDKAGTFPLPPSRHFTQRENNGKVTDGKPQETEAAQWRTR